MKKFFASVICLVLTISLVACGTNEKVEDAMQQEKIKTDMNSTGEVVHNDEVVKAEVVDEVKDGLIRFRGIKWYSSKKDVESFLFENGADVGGWRSDDNTIYRMSGIDYTNMTTGEDTIDGGGYKGWYSGVYVAGYEASDTYACYIYPINDDGSINVSEDNAQFYFGWYTFTKEDYSDILSIYEDLKIKLCALYGKGYENKSDFRTTMNWKDTENNQVRLLIDSDSTYITLGYMANGAEERLDKMQSALDKVAAQKEEEKREENKQNTSGL